MDGDDRPPPRHAPGEPFLLGPIARDWWAAACRLPGKSLHVASVVAFRAGCSVRPEFRLGLGSITSLGVRHDAAARGLAALEDAGLVAVRRLPGCKPVVRPVGLRGQGGRHAGGRVLQGPIPWGWWAQACRLPGRSPHVASALWLLAGHGGGRASTFPLGPGAWAELGLGPDSLRRGLGHLEAAGLVDVRRGPGRRPVVTLRPAPTAGHPCPSIDPSS